MTRVKLDAASSQMWKRPSSLKSVVVLTNVRNPASAYGTPVALTLLRVDDQRIWRVTEPGRVYPTLASPDRGDFTHVINNPAHRLDDSYAQHWGVCEAYWLES